jgi:hypothetical protein
MIGLWGLIIALFVVNPWGFPGLGMNPEVDKSFKAFAQEQDKKGSITKVRIEPLYRAVRLTWKANIKGGGPVTFEIYRSMATPDGPYELITSIEWKAGKKKYRYVDKKLPVEENYFYKIEIPATRESVGPLQVRPPFSLPTT